MLRFSLFCLLAIAAFTGGIVGAQAVSVQEAFEKYNQIGMWAWDCSKPPSDNNHYFVNRVIDADHVQRDAMSGPSKRDHVSIIDKATPLGPNEIALSGTYDDKPTDAVWLVEGDRQTTTEFTLDGKKVVSAGKIVSNGRPIHSTSRCGARRQQGQSPAAAQQAQMAAPAAACTAQAKRKFTDLIAGYVQTAVSSQGHSNDYPTAPTPKVFAACINWVESTPDRRVANAFWFTTGRFSSDPNVIEQEAMSRCSNTQSAKSGSCTCQIVSRNGSMAIQFPEGWAEKGC